MTYLALAVGYFINHMWWHLVLWVALALVYSLSLLVVLAALVIDSFSLGSVLYRRYRRGRPAVLLS